MKTEIQQKKKKTEFFLSHYYDINFKKESFYKKLKTKTKLKYSRLNIF